MFSWRSSKFVERCRCFEFLFENDRSVESIIHFSKDFLHLFDFCSKLLKKKQLLYDFPTFGNDKASDSYFLQPEQYWNCCIGNRKWISLSLSISYRMTPNIASFCNLYWGTSIKGGNKTSPNIPIEYHIKHPYPPKDIHCNADGRLSTNFLAQIIDNHGPENVLFLAHSVLNDKTPVSLFHKVVRRGRLWDCLRIYVCCVLILYFTVCSLLLDEFDLLFLI